MTNKFFGIVPRVRGAGQVQQNKNRTAAAASGSNDVGSTAGRNRRPHASSRAGEQGRATAGVYDGTAAGGKGPRREEAGK